MLSRFAPWNRWDIFGAEFFFIYHGRPRNGEYHEERRHRNSRPLVDRVKMERNIRRMVGVAQGAGLRLRPHTKTHKCPAIAKIQLGLGARGITVAKIGEAEVMADAGLDDVLVAYPIVGERKLTRFLDLNERIRTACTTDSYEVAAGLSAAARARGQTVRLFVEVDSGMGRVGLPPGEPALELVR